MPPNASPALSTIRNDDHPSAHTTGTSARFVLKAADLLKDLVFSGAPGQDIVELLAQYRARVKLNSVDNCPDHVVDQRAVREGLRMTPLQLTQGTLEWRNAEQLAALRAKGASTRPVAPSSWTEYCHALYFQVSAPNRISILARAFATLEQAADQSVDTYALRVTQARASLIAEATRSAPRTSARTNTHGMYSPLQRLKTA